MSAQPFAFAREFKTNDSRFAPIETPEPTLSLSEHERAVKAAADAAAARAYEQGLAAGRAEQTARLAAATEDCTRAIAALSIALDDVHDRSTGEAIHFAGLFAQTLSNGLSARLPTGALEAAARALFADLRGAPHLVVRVAPDLVEPATAKIKAIARERGHEGRLIVMGEPEIATGDAILEWADGGLVIDRAATAAAVSAAVTALTGALDPAPGRPHPARQESQP